MYDNIGAKDALRICEEAAKIEEQRLNSIIKLSQQKTSSLKELLDLSLREALTLTDSRFGFIFYYCEDREEFTLHAWSQDIMKECKIKEPRANVKLESTGIWGEVVRKRRAIVINDFQASNPLKKGYPPGHAHLFRFMGVPVITDDRIVAVIGVANKTEDYSDADVRQLSLMMDSIWKIAERFKVEETLKKSEEKFSKVFQSSPAAMHITRLRDKHIIEINQAFIHLSGFTQQEVIGRRATELGIYPDFNAREHIIKTTLEEGRIANYDIRFNAKGNKLLFCRISTELIQLEEMCMLSTITDLTEIKHAEEALRESEAKIRALNEELEKRVIKRTAELEQANRDLLAHSKKLEESTRRLGMLSQAIDSSPICVVMTNKHKNIVYANSQVAIVTGYSISELLGQNPRIFKSGQHSDEYYKTMWTALDKGFQWSGEFCNKKKNGELFWESSTISPVFNKNGILTNYIAVKEDITKRKQMIQEMEIAKLAAEAANRAKSTFLANMSHEIRTPMNAILGYTQLLQRDISLGPDQKEYIQIVNQSGEHLLALINDILEMSKIESGRVLLDPEDFSLTDLLDDCAKMFRMQILQKELLFNIELVSQIPSYIRADGKKIRQVLINIIGNSLKFTDKGSICIRVMCSNTQIQNQIFFNIEVEDTGCGMAPEEIGKVFEAFEQTQSGRRQGSSTGLGMPISRHYARLMGGDLTVTSKLGEGSKFCFTLIADRVSSKALISKEIPTQRAVIGLVSATQPKILVVDDIVTNRTLLRQILEKTGFSVQEAVDGREAILLFTQWKPDVILMDARMPKMNGFEATRLIKASPSGKRVGVIIITASVLENDRLEALQSGADGFIRKPFKEGEIFKELQHILAIDYRYEDDDQRNFTNEVFEETALLVDQVPAQLASRIVEAAKLGESILLKELISQKVMPYNSRLGHTLLNHANDYDYKSITEIMIRGGIK